MNIAISSSNGIQIAEIIADQVVISNVETALDLIGNCGYQGAQAVIMDEALIAPEFFDLKTGLAGEVLQKFTTYGLKLAIVGDFSKYASKSLQDFIRESNRGRKINFVSNREEAAAALSV